MVTEPDGNAECHTQGRRPPHTTRVLLTGLLCLYVFNSKAGRKLEESRQSYHLAQNGHILYSVPHTQNPGPSSCHLGDADGRMALQQGAGWLGVGTVDTIFSFAWSLSGRGQFRRQKLWWDQLVGFEGSGLPPPTP